MKQEKSCVLMRPADRVLVFAGHLDVCLDPNDPESAAAATNIMRRTQVSHTHTLPSVSSRRRCNAIDWLLTAADLTLRTILLICKTTLCCVYP